MSHHVDESPPRALKARKLSYGARLSLETARRMLESGEQEAKKQAVPMSMAIADNGGNLLAFNRMDDAMLSSTNIAIDKAFTTVFSKRSTKTCGEVVNSGGLIPLFLHERWITFPGGYPIISNGIILGGVGVSGGTFEDIYVARAILKAGGFDTEEADATLAQIEGKKKD
ncbi:heme-binding protein [Chloroflexota bacterium]